MLCGAKAATHGIPASGSYPPTLANAEILLQTAPDERLNYRIFFVRRFTFNSR